MPRVRQLILLHRFGMAALGATAMVLASSGLANAQYGPPPGPIPVPGGYDQVVTSQTIGSGGTTIGPVTGGNVTVKLVVPAGSVPAGTHVTITQPDVSAIGNADFHGYTAVGGIGIVLQNPDGSDYHGYFNRPLIVTLTSANLAPGDIIVAWNGDHFERVDAVVHGHTAIIRLTGEASQYQYFAILSPSGTGLRGSAAPLHSTEAVFAGLLMPTVGSPLPGVGVLAPEYLRAFGALSFGLAN